jgi:hypothetical protein
VLISPWGGRRRKRQTQNGEEDEVMKEAADLDGEEVDPVCATT